MKKYFCTFIFLLVLSASSITNALPRFALKKGEANCFGCHVNPTGGQLRGPGGVSFELNALPMWKRGDSIKYTGEISEGIRLGGDFRSQMLYFANTIPVYAGSSDSTGGKPSRTKVNDKTTRTTTFHAMSLAFELDVHATNTLHGFFRYDPLGITPSEGWAILHVVHQSGEILESSDAVQNAYIKVGSFLPAFGIRFDDHTVYVKGGTASLSGFDRAGFWWSPGYRDVGFELGALFFDRLGIVAGMFNGNETAPSDFSFDPNNSKAYCIRLNLAEEIIEDKLAVEVGFSEYYHPHDNGQNLSLSAAHLSLRAGPVTILNEYDFGKNVIVSGDGDPFPKASALCSEAAVHVAKGLDLLARYETFKDEKPEGTSFVEVKNRIMIGAQWFPLRFLELRPEFRIAKVVSADLNSSDQKTENTILVQTHVFF